MAPTYPYFKGDVTVGLTSSTLPRWRSPYINIRIYN